MFRQRLVLHAFDYTGRAPTLDPSLGLGLTLPGLGLDLGLTVLWSN